MKVYKYPTREEWPELTRRPEADAGALEEIVRNILQEVRLNGDAALKKFTLQFDKAGIDQLQVEPEDFLRAQQVLDATLKASILSAKVNIETFHKTQLKD